MLPFGKTPKQTRLEMIKYFFPRIALLRKRLGYGLNLGNVQFRHYTSAGVRVVYHSVKQFTIMGIKETLRGMQNEGTLMADSDYGINALPWVMALIFLAGKAPVFSTTLLGHEKAKMSLCNDILKNYSVVEPDLFEENGIYIRH